MMPDTHPHEFLAGYVDGTLSADEQVRVEAHLGSCDRCRDEAALAMQATPLLRDLPDEVVPAGTTDPVMTEIHRRLPARRHGSWARRGQALAGLAAAAALVAVVVVELPHLGSSGISGKAASSEAARPANGEATVGAGAPERAVILERQSVNYDDTGLAALATQIARSSDRLSPNPSSPGSFVSSAAQPALACVGHTLQLPATDRLVRLIQARYKGASAYIAAYLDSPSPGQRPQQVVLWVVGTRTCGILQVTSKRI